ncbi:single-stranded DNA-binding protein [Clostridium tertium]
MNKVILIGRLTKDPEVNFIPTNGKAVVRFSLAVSRAYKKDEADFINCKAFGKTAETIANYITKGRQIAVIGSLRTGSYEDKDGSKRYTTEVWIESFNFIGNNKSDSNNTEYNPNLLHEELTPVDDGEMPF